MVLSSGEQSSTEVSTSLQQSRSQSFSRSNSVVNATSVTKSQSLTASAQANYPWGASMKVEGTVSRTENSMTERTSSWSRSSAQSSQAAYARGLAESRREDTTIESGILAAQIMIRNEGRRTFKVSDVVVTALRPSSLYPTELTSVASLELPEAANELVLGEGEEAGPFRVEAEISANTAMKLMANPSGIVFQVASRRLTDFERQDFAFSIGEQTYNRTASIVIDYGDAREVETYRVATNARRSTRGEPAGIGLREALEEILGMEPGVDFETETRNGRQVLTGLRGVRVSAPSQSGPARFWAVMASSNEDPDVPDSAEGRILKASFDEIRLHKRDKLYLAYVQDADRDGLFAREEYLYGSFDDSARVPPGAPAAITAQDSDGDGLTDFEEIREGWWVASPTAPYDERPQVFPDPTSVDADQDGLSDPEERELGTDPKAPDTDGDGISDADDPNPLQPELRTGPSLLALSPAAHAVVPIDVVVEARFDQPLSTEATLRVNGSFQGAIAGTTQLSADGRTLRWQAAAGLLPGEEVELSVGPSVVNRDGLGVDQPVVRRFRAAAAPSAGRLAAATDLVGEGGWVEAMMPGDFDGDGAVDLMVGKTSHFSLLRWVDGAYAHSSSGFVMEDWDGMASGDVDRDGLPDVVAIDGSSVYVFRNAADGTGMMVEDGVPYRASAANRSADVKDLDLADMNGDGFLDIVTANRASQEVAVLWNNRDGRFSTPTLISLRTEDEGANRSPYLVKTLDVDQDGDLDIVAGEHSSGSASIILNHGGWFELLQRSSTGGYPLSKILSGDFTGDGFPDLMMTLESADVAFMPNDRAGAFGATIELRKAGHPQGLTSGDIDGDGDLDLLAPDQSSDLLLWRNGGGGTFPTTERILSEVDATWGQYDAVATLDVDGDGDLDVAKAGNQGIELLINE